MFDESHVIYRYKYLPCSDGALKTLTEGTIKFTCPLDFNDPFDCLPYYDVANINQIPSIRPDLFKAAGNRRGLSPAQRLQKKGEFVARLRNHIVDGSFANSLLKTVGVVSLSKNPLNILMWSHYADYHKGFVIELRIPVMGYMPDIMLSTDRLLPFPVIYQENRPKIDIGNYTKESLLNEILLTKSTNWAYEEEERVIAEDRPPGIFKYRRDEILCSVIAGMRIRNENYQRLQSICETIEKKSISNLKLYKAEPIADTYELQVPGHPRLARQQA